MAPSLMVQRKSNGGGEPMVPVGGGWWQPPPENPTWEAKNEAGVIRCGSGLCRCLSPSLPSVLSQGWHWVLAPWRSGLNKHKNGHSWLQPRLPHGHPSVLQADTRSSAPSPAACCSLKLLFTGLHLPVSSWFLDVRAAGPGRRGGRYTWSVSVSSVGLGSSYI